MGERGLGRVVRVLGLACLPVASGVYVVLSNQQKEQCRTVESKGRGNQLGAMAFSKHGGEPCSLLVCRGALLRIVFERGEECFYHHPGSPTPLSN